MAENIKYSAKVDTSIYSSEKCAEKIMKELFITSFIKNISFFYLQTENILFFSVCKQVKP